MDKWQKLKQKLQKMYPNDVRALAGLCGDMPLVILLEIMEDIDKEEKNGGLNEGNT